MDAVKNCQEKFDDYSRTHLDWADPVGEVEVGKLVEFAPVKLKTKIRGTLLNGKDMLRRRIGKSGGKFAGYGGSSRERLKSREDQPSDTGSADRPLSASRWSDSDMSLSESPPIRSRPTRPPAGVAAWETPARQGRQTPGSRKFLLAPISTELNGSLAGQHYATQSLDTRR